MWYSKVIQILLFEYHKDTIINIINKTNNIDKPSIEIKTNNIITQKAIVICAMTYMYIVKHNVEYLHL